MGSQKANIAKIREIRAVRAIINVTRLITFPWALTKIK